MTHIVTFTKAELDKATQRAKEQEALHRQVSAAYHAMQAAHSAEPCNADSHDADATSSNVEVAGTQRNQVITVATAAIGIIQASPARMGGTPVFAGTRVPVKTLFDYLATGDSIDRFLDHFPDVSREQVTLLLYRVGEELNRCI